MITDPTIVNAVFYRIVANNRWQTAEELATMMCYPIEDINLALDRLHKTRQISRFKGFLGAYKYARVRELVGMPFGTRPTT